ncbi:MAG: DEAD/DEAH box helicase [Verrucomicrobiales bacterium]
MPEFTELGLSEAALEGVRDQGFENPTPIQEQSIPAILQGRDLIGASQTGTGKTAAFALPIITKLGEHRSTRCLILEPTRELAAQVQNHFELLGKHTNLQQVLVHGGVGYGQQNDLLKGGADIVIATPGRLLDHMSRGNVSLKTLEVIVLDETDRMLDMGFLPDVRKIVTQCPRNRQTLLFSATMPRAIQGLAEWALNDPLEIEIGRRSSVAETINHAFYPVSADQRDELILTLLERTDFHSVMIFTRTKREADQLTREVKRIHPERVTTLHSDIPQRDRTKALEGFRNGDYDIIIATDVAARGLDLRNVSHVINYRVPENAEDYVHRIGRTGRAQTEGDAFTVLSADEIPFAESIERYIGQKIEKRKLDNFDYVYTTLIDDDPPRPVKRPRRRMTRRRR